jgi:hypothetical protein
MANLTESAVYEPNVYKIETTDAVLGGAETAPANIQAKQLANRTKWLKGKIDLAGIGSTGAVEFSGNLNSVLASGWYFATSSASNKPVLAEGFLNVSAYPALDYGIQIFYSFQTDQVFYRGVADGPTFGSWIELAKNSDIQSMVSAIASFPRTSAPAGWLKCNGAAVSRTTYASLFAIIGTTFGAGNGTTTFNLPDMRGEFIRGLDDGRGIDTGRTLGSAQAYATETHHHTLQRTTNVGGGSDGYDLGNYVNGGSGPVSLVNVQDYGDTETRPRNIALLYCIKY